ncbi:MAG: penicillin-binding protein 1A [Pseudomonadota bacterium]
MTDEKKTEPNAASKDQASKAERKPSDAQDSRAMTDETPAKTEASKSAAAPLAAEKRARLDGEGGAIVADGEGRATYDATETGGSGVGGVLKFLAFGFGAASVFGVAVAIGVAVYVSRLSADLPDYKVLAEYEPPITTRMHAGDGSLIAEFARERRLFVPVEAIPDVVKEAFISAEDKNFYTHGGLDGRGIVRAAIANVGNKLAGRRLEGASTITQQVAKNFLLSSEQRLERKVREMLLALRIERAFTKDEILELYLNEIYLGAGSYGVAAAALNYFDKALEDVTVAEAAYLAALPKAPSYYHPVRKKDVATARRNWVIGRMAVNAYITEAEASAAQAQELVATVRPRGAQFVAAEYFAEEVRRQVDDMYGPDVLYDGGLSIRTTVDTALQKEARRALRDGLIAYDLRHGWRGPVATIETGEGWLERLNDVKAILDIDPWRMAVVLDTSSTTARIGLRDGTTGAIPFSQVSWARPALENGNVGEEVGAMTEILSVGDVVYVEELTPAMLARIAAADAAEAETAGDAQDSANEVEDVAPELAAADPGPRQFALRQIPEVNGGIVAIDPHTGRVLAMIGGFSFQHSQFNRATQAFRQPGSAFKPFVYAAALDRGYTPSSLILDAPFVAQMGGLTEGWYKPENYTDRFYGESTLRLGIEKSRNVMTVRLAQDIGMRPIADYADRFNIVEDMPPVLSMALGAGETTLMRLTSAYAMLVNGGKYVEPVLVDRVQDRTGKTVFKKDLRPCSTCKAVEWREQSEPMLPDNRDQVVDSRTAYQVTSMLEGVVQRGTGRSIKAVGRPLAGKTGTTNDAVDAWFVGFSPDLAVGVYVGFDTPRSLGARESGGTVAAPIFRDFMQAAIGAKPGVPFRIPSGIKLVRVNAQTGRPARPSDGAVILEAFKTEDLLETSDGGQGPASQTNERVEDSLGGLY